jgi:D-3-phosphoglycerate dehydrogenase
MTHSFSPLSEISSSNVLSSGLSSIAATLHDFRTILIDFDSTLVQVESLDVLAELTLAGRSDKVERCAEIVRYTEAAMEGELTFTESLRRRIELLCAHKRDIEPLIALLNTKLSPSVVRNQLWFRAHAERIFVVSGGFIEFIVPVVERLGIKADHVFANEFVYAPDGLIIGADETNPLAHELGKPTLVKRLSEQGIVKHPACIIGDGYSDYQLRAEGAVEMFIALVENVHREKTTSLADFVITCFDEIIT